MCKLQKFLIELLYGIICCQVSCKKATSLHTHIKESIYIRVNNPTLNRNIGKFNLSHIWDRVLFNTPGLKLNNNKGQGQIHSNRQSPQCIPPMGQLQGQSEHALDSEHVLRGSYVHMNCSNARFVLRPYEVHSCE